MLMLIMKAFVSILIILLTIRSISIAQTPHIIIIGIDGLGAYGVKKFPTPVLDSMMQHGSYTLKAKAVNPTYSMPNWASITMGVPTKIHQIKSNGWTRAQSPRRNRTSEIPTMFKVISDSDSSMDIAIFNHWKEFLNLVEPELPLYSIHIDNSDSITHHAIQYQNTYHPVLNFIHLDLVDKAGHKYGLKSEEYKGAVMKADSLAGAIIHSVLTSTQDKNYIFLVTSDHGIKGKGHGGMARKIKRIPWIATGYNIKAGNEIKRKVHTYDTACTIIKLLNLEIPQEWTGKVIEEIFR
ncbi:MAG TPA: alkaline phosphatase [Cytophagaceae bacterium]